MTISTPVMATSIIERLKKVKKRLLSSATGSSECPLMLIRNCKNGKTLHCVLHEVHDREDDNPNDVYEVPVKADFLHHLVVFAAFEYALNHHDENHEIDVSVYFCLYFSLFCI